jgi:monothiol glutaredoxin
MEEFGRQWMNDDLKARFDRETREHEVVIYMKGNALFPRCGFSAAALQLLQKHSPVHAVDVLSEPELREGIKEYTRWPTIPQVFIRGQFVGGSDIVRDLDEKGELEKLIKGQ